MSLLALFFIFVWTKTTWKTRFSENDSSTKIISFFWQSFPQKWPCDCCFLNSSAVVWKKYITTVFVDTRLWKTNIRGNISKISVSLTCYRNMRSTLVKGGIKYLMYLPCIWSLTKARSSISTLTPVLTRSKAFKDTTALHTFDIWCQRRSKIPWLCIPLISYVKGVQR